MSRRAEIVLSPDEQAELLDERAGRDRLLARPARLAALDADVVHGPRRRDLDLDLRKSQKVKNLERDPRATLLIETGTEYMELRGVQIEAEAELIRDPETVFEFGKELTVRYAEGIDSIEGDAAAALQAQAAKRVAIRFEPVRVATWDHRKLGGTY